MAIEEAPAPGQPLAEPAPAQQDYAEILAGDLEIGQPGALEQPGETRARKVAPPRRELRADVEPTLAPVGEQITAPRAADAAPIDTTGLELEQPGARKTPDAIDYVPEIETAGLALEKEGAPAPAKAEAVDKVEPVDEVKLKETLSRVSEKVGAMPDKELKKMLVQVGVKTAGTRADREKRVVAMRELAERYKNVKSVDQLETLFRGEENVTAARLINQTLPTNQQTPEMRFIASWQNARRVASLVNRMGGNIQPATGEVAPEEKPGDIQYKKVPGQYSAPDGFIAQDAKAPATMSRLKSIPVDIPVRVRETGDVEMITYSADEAISYEDGRISALQKLKECLAG
jgi:hypothetical protein